MSISLREVIEESGYDFDDLDDLYRIQAMLEEVEELAEEVEEAIEDKERVYDKEEEEAYIAEMEYERRKDED